MRGKIVLQLIAALSLCAFGVQSRAQNTKSAEEGSQAEQIAALKAEVERLKSIVPAQAVAMTQVAYNFDNLWFAVQAKNWPLAQFYFNETRTRLRWAIRIVPKRKISSGQVELAPILQSVEAGPLAALGRTVAGKDVQEFRPAYQAVMNACVGCHTAAERPFLRLQIPQVPAEPMIDFEGEKGE
ncbi:MAG TPA: hypothetical protein VFY39_13920 [Gammaproteobacteria bacterium]|nr:hypothetical protein [Gammaproteobacteria bacterium]